MGATRRYRPARTRPARSATPLVRILVTFPAVGPWSGEGRSGGAGRRGVPGAVLRGRLRVGRGRPGRPVRPPERPRRLAGRRAGAGLHRPAAPARGGRDTRAVAPGGGGGGLSPPVGGARSRAVGAAGGGAAGPGASPSPATWPASW